jgi:minichromosome maintenance protein 10
LTVVAVPTSPQRVLLGIDRGKKASEVSLKNPWKPPTTTPEKPKTTFADRLAVAARENKRKNTIQDERERKKAKSFSATALASTLSPPTTKPSRPKASQPVTSQRTQTAPTDTAPQQQQNQEEWCKYTGFNLRTRRLPQSILKEEFRGKTTYSVSDLYRLVTPPSFDPPEYDTLDFLVTGIVAQKSPVRQVKGRGENYLVVKITDLKVFYPFISFPFVPHLPFKLYPFLYRKYHFSPQIPSQILQLTLLFPIFLYIYYSPMFAGPRFIYRWT